MTSILKVDTIQDTAGNNIINESSDTITIGASGDTITIPSGATISNLGTASGFGGANTPYFQAYRSGSEQSISAGAWTKVQINSEVVDSDSAYDNSTNYRFTPLTSGKYYIFGQVTSATSTDMDRVMSAIYLNGSQISQSNSFSGDSSSSYTATIVDMNGSSDYVELYGYFGVTTGTDLQGRGTFFGGYKLID
jgi:hypothetical protein